MKKSLKTRILSLILALVMLVGVVPGTELTVNAEEGNGLEQSAEVANCEEVPVTSVALDQEVIELEVAKTVTLNAILSPVDVTDKTITWLSDNEAVATVENGVVTAVTEGTANVIAKAGEFSAACTVTVKATDQQEIQEPVALAMLEDEIAIIDTKM